MRYGTLKYIHKNGLECTENSFNLKALQHHLITTDAALSPTKVVYGDNVRVPHK